MSSKGKLTFLKLGHTSKQKDSYTIVVMGAEEAGKTALIVRFLTRKYLPEYTHGSISCYERSVPLDDKSIPVRIVDTPGKETFGSLEKQDVLSGSDGYLVVYSIIDKKSFQKIKETLKMIHQESNDSRPPPPPVALIGNKEDLIHLRTVSTVEGQKLALAYPGCSFFECSAAKDAENVEHAFSEFLREVLQTKDSKRHLNANCTLTVKSPSNHRRNSAGNSTLSSWWKRPRSSSACENRQDRTFTM